MTLPSDPAQVAKEITEIITKERCFHAPVGPPKNHNQWFIEVNTDFTLRVRELIRAALTTFAAQQVADVRRAVWEEAAQCLEVKEGMLTSLDAAFRHFNAIWSEFRRRSRATVGRGG